MAIQSILRELEDRPTMYDCPQCMRRVVLGDVSVSVDEDGHGVEIVCPVCSSILLEDKTEKAFDFSKVRTLFGEHCGNAPILLPDKEFGHTAFIEYNAREDDDIWES